MFAKGEHHLPIIMHPPCTYDGLQNRENEYLVRNECPVIESRIYWQVTGLDEASL